MNRIFFSDENILGDIMIKSMTAFARKQIQNDLGTMSWELRSVNHRYLEMSLHLPESFRVLEVALREKIGKQVVRGRVDCALRYQPGRSTNYKIQMNDTVIDELNHAFHRIGEKLSKEQQINPIDILQWPGVMQIVDTDQSELHKVMLSLFDETLSELNQGRQREGEKLAGFIDDRLTQVKEQLFNVKKEFPTIIQSHRDQLLTRFKEAQVDLDPSRLEQEMVVLAQRLDITEELDRLDIHTEEIQRVIKKGGSVGRRLDFLMQEMNREANTLGSKSMSDITTRASVELKVLIEQIREQVQNIE